MRTVKTLKPENRGVGRPAALSGTRSSVPWIADARRPGRGLCDPAGGTAGRLAGEGRTTTGEVRRRPVGPGPAGPDTAARRGGAPGPAASSGRWRWLDVGRGG